MLPVRVYWWDEQRAGNNNIRIGKKREVEWFKGYKIFVLEEIDRNIGNSTEEPDRRYYVEDEHIKKMKDDPRIDLKRGWIWKENK